MFPDETIPGRMLWKVAGRKNLFDYDRIVVLRGTNYAEMSR